MDTSALPSPVTGSVVRELTLPSGGRAVLRDPAELRAKDKRHVVRSIKDGQQARGRVQDVQDGTICMLVEKWEVPYLPNAPLPRDMPDILDELSIRDYDALLDATTPAVQALFPDSSADDADKPGSPTEPASD